MRRSNNTHGRDPRFLVGTAAMLIALLVLDHIAAGMHQASAAEFSAHVLVALVAAVLAGTTCAMACARKTSQRLKALAEKLQLVAAGDYSVRAEIKRIDDFGELGRAFNSTVESLSHAHDLLMERANTDSVTGLNNHRHFQERLAIEFSRAARYGSKLSLLMIDIDHFKLFNDMNGHPSGDNALREIAGIIAEQARDVDIAARYGGEEFAVILPETGSAQANILAERIRNAAETCVFEQTSPQCNKLTLSIGVAEFPSHCSDRASLLRAADGALYQSKMMGRNMVVTFAGESGCDPKPDPHKLYVLLHATDLNTVEALAAAIDAKHGYPAGHSVSVAGMASEIGEKLGLNTDERTSLYVATLLRDVGQIAIPDTVLEKANTLDAAEKELVEKHPVLGYAIVQKSPYMSAMLPAILYHHERFDGAGYPEGLSGDQIPLSARIVAVVDAYQSMMVARPYRDKLTSQAAQSELGRLAGTQFDPTVVSALTAVVSDHLRKAA